MAKYQYEILVDGTTTRRLDAPGKQPNQYEGLYLTELQQDVMEFLARQGGTWRQGDNGERMDVTNMQSVRRRGLVTTRKVLDRLIYSITKLGWETLHAVRFEQGKETLALDMTGAEGASCDAATAATAAPQTAQPEQGVPDAQPVLDSPSADR